MPGTTFSRPKEAPDCGLDARPGTDGQFAEQLSIETRVHSETLRDRQHDLPVRDGATDVFGHVDGGQQGTLLVTGWGRATLFAGVGDKHL